MTMVQLERRIQSLERRLTHLTQQVKPQGKKARWWVDGAGRFADDPAFDAIVKLGRQYRRSLKPALARGKRADS